MLLEPSLYTVKAIAILDNDGNRILAKYFDDKVLPTSKEQKAEAALQQAYFDSKEY